MSTLKDFWKYLLYKQKIHRVSIIQGGTFAELGQIWFGLGPLFFLIFGFPLILFLFMVSWQVALLPLMLYLLFLVLLVKEFYESYRTVKDKPSLASLKNINKKIDKARTREKSKKIIYLMIFLGVMLVFTWRIEFVPQFLMGLLTICFVAYLLVQKQEINNETRFLFENKKIKLKGLPNISQEQIVVLLGFCLLLFDLYYYREKVLTTAFGTFSLSIILIVFGIYRMVRKPKIP